MIWLMARAGLRVGEVLALQRSDVDLGGKRLSVNGSMLCCEGLRPVKGREGRGESFRCLRTWRTALGKSSLSQEGRIPTRPYTSLTL